MELRLEREPSTAKSTPGVLFVDGVRICYTLEDVIRERRYDDGALIAVSTWKIPNQTAIASGRYAVTLDYSIRFHKVMPHILGVQGFTGVRIHGGNTSADTEGCVLVGRYRRSADLIYDCAPALDALIDKLEFAASRHDPIFITIDNPRTDEVPILRT